VLAGIAAASVRGRRTLGARPGAVVVRHGNCPGSRHCDSGRAMRKWHGFDLHAAVVVPSRDRARLEPL
jgi:hypothetical protein